MNKSFIIAALAAVSVNGYSNYAKKRVNATKMHLEKVYGKNLIGLFDDEGKMSHARWRSARMRPAYNSQPIYKIGTIDAETSSAWFYGYAKGL